MTLYLKKVASPIGELRLYANDRAVVGLVMAEEVRKGRDQTFFPFQEKENKVLGKVEAELKAFFAGRLKKFSVSLQVTGTEFQKEVWKTLLKIEYGALWTYGEVARILGRPKAVRAVGGIIGRNPIPLIIPCHRVVGTDASLTGFGGGLAAKQILLEIEGHQITERMLKNSSITGVGK